MIEVLPNIKIPKKELSFSFSKASGSGGQKINKTNISVELRWNLLESLSISNTAKNRILEKIESKLTNLGELVITSSRFREQSKNMDDCIEKFILCLQKAYFRPVKRKKTNVPKAQKKKRLDSKRKRAEIKQMRSKKF